ncbi:YbgA family protein [Methanothermobacter wolfeii]|uniref:YbgA family protein n=1 Tax=Methanothermobacter wolfeii TaxID=145261 RepID=UPI0024B33DE1|nr:DUF523 and DUF1722 domain-containing protein [Methanothermobacter wolfeii]MDI6702320.1 DUF523 and DUF1722 domain-containing protein [Methanothermobacter wolfeii]MDI6842285.1 DUF523 and DUF1722 domain-containing protein [Methanothermobacter wolfeii]
MRKFRRPLIVLSRCIEHDHCRYDGSMISSPFVRQFSAYADFITVCPEVEVGLGIPRPPIHITEEDGVLRLVQPETGRDITDDMNSFIDSFLDSLEIIDGFILKNKSPSCGIKNVKVYRDDNPRPRTDGMGFFGRKVKERFPYLAVEDEGRLRNLQIREDFLIKIYLMRDFRAVGKLRDLIEFHTENKMLLMSYDPAIQARLGRIIAEQDHEDFDTVLSEYRKMLCMATRKSLKPGRNINTLLHAFGHFSSELTHEEKNYFLESLEGYRKGLLPLIVPISLLKSWIIRFDDEYLKGQTFFEPYPRELVPVTLIV